MDQPQRTRHYLSPLYDSARWDRLTLRAGDVIVATPYKAGTTWTQYLCAMAVHGGPSLPKPLSELSIWVDTALHSDAEVAEAIDHQTWRRVLKSHTPLDGLPYREDVSYVVCARDPRDAFLSMRDHAANFKAERTAALLKAAGLPENLQFPSDVDVLFQLWMTTPSQPWTRDGFPFGPYFHHLASFYEFRHLPNIHLTHYESLSNDLGGAFDKLSAFLGIALAPSQRHAILSAASFEAMRDDADKLAPLAHQGVWNDSREFFRARRSGAWRHALSAESQAMYGQLTRERYPDGFLRWIEFTD